jgi:hypothetical protein
MDNKAAYAYLIALAVPFIVGLLSKCSWPAIAKFGITAALSVAIGLGTLAIDGAFSDWQWSKTLPFIVSIVGASEVYFRLFVDATGIKPWLLDHFHKDEACPPDPTQP